MRLILICLTAMLVLIQYPLWLGKGGWLRVRALSVELDVELAKEQVQKIRNDKLASEVADLKDGTGAVEELARFELGMIKEDETFVQILQPDSKKVARGVLPAASPSSKQN